MEQILTATITLKPISANQTNCKDYGMLIGDEIAQERLPIPFYKHVEEGRNIPFEYHGQAVLRTARIHPTQSPCIWLERHLRMTQFFIGLGQVPFRLILAKANERPAPGDLPDLSTLRCFQFEPGSGILLNKGTWHDFPLAVDSPVTCFTGNSDEVVKALVTLPEPMEMDEGDVYKINLIERLETQIEVR